MTEWIKDDNMQELVLRIYWDTEILGHQIWILGY